MEENNDLLLARQWLAHLTAQQAGKGPADVALPDRWINAAGLLVGAALAAGKTIRIVVPDDETLPELSNALDIELRPLCLILPEAPFASRIALRATLTLLKSRLTRQADDKPMWQMQQARIARLAGTWQAALAWGQSESRASWPEDIGHLFPASLMPASQALLVDTDSDMHVLIAPERMTGNARDFLARRRNVLCLSAFDRGRERRQLVPFDETARQRFELDMLTREIAELELELATAQAEVANFSQRYHAAVGPLLVELDQLQARLAEQIARRRPDDDDLQDTARHSQERAERSRREQQRFEDIPRQTTGKSFRPAAELKKLYRLLAQKIHPDRAENEIEREWRTTLMAEATRAYRSENEAVLQEIFRQWQSGGARNAAGVAEVNPMALQIERLKARLGNIQAELDRLLASRLYELLIANRLAARQGRNLLQEMANELQRQIEAALQELANFIDEEDSSPCKPVTG